MSRLDRVRRSTLATLDEIKASEARLRANGIDATDPDDWQQLKDIVARIERKLAASAGKPKPKTFGDAIRAAGGRVE